MGKPRFIQTKTGALFAVIVTGFVGYQSLRGILHHHTQHSPWIIAPFDPIPHWLAVALNVLMYLSLAWLSLVVMKMGSGKERAILVGWSSAVLLGLAQPFVSLEAATSIQYVKALAMGMAFLGSILLALTFFVPDQPFRSE